MNSIKIVQININGFINNAEIQLHDDRILIQSEYITLNGETIFYYYSALFGKYSYYITAIIYLIIYSTLFVVILYRHRYLPWA